MSLMKWFRKHNRKMLAVGVVVLMFVWLIPSTLRFSCRSAGPGGSKAVALFGKKEKITVSDIQQAHAELSILREIRADVLLRGRDVHGAALTELLFSESRTSPFLIASLRQEI
jgi:hypothetical protein